MDIMLDLETLSTAPDAAIVSIGACTFETSGTPNSAARSTFRQVVHADTSQAAGGRIDAKTVIWWFGQEQAARDALTLSPALSIEDALHKFTSWVESLAMRGGGRIGGGRLQRVRVWGNGAGFDNIVLRGAYDRSRIAPPWRYQDDRCYRTLKNLRRDIAFEQLGIAHDALHDAVSQATQAEKIFAALKGA